MEETTYPVSEPLSSAVTPLQTYFLGRLEHVLQLRFEQSGNLNEGGAQLLDRAIYSTYCDCLDLSLTDRAREIMRKFPAIATEQQRN